MGEIYNLFRQMISNMIVGTQAVVFTYRLGEYTFAVHNYPAPQDFAPQGCDPVPAARAYKLHIWRYDRLVGIADKYGEDTIIAAERPRVFAALEAQINSRLPSNKL